MNSIQQLLITVNFIFIINSVFSTYKIHVCSNNKINTINENLEHIKEFQSIFPDGDQQLYDGRNEDDDTDATLKAKRLLDGCIYSKMLPFISSGIRSTMYKYNYKETIVKFYDSNCQFQKVIQKEGNNPMILEAYALANMNYLRVLYDVVNDYEESFKNPIIITNQTTTPYGINNIVTNDFKFIIKFLNECEFNEYTSMFLDMFSHFCEHPKSFLQKISGLYRIKYNSEYYYFTIIFNTYPLKLDKNRIKLYDLTGSGTSVNEKEGEQTSDSINCNFENDWPGGITIPYSNIYDSIIHDLECDLNLLKSLNKMDYSLFMVVIKYNIKHTNKIGQEIQTLMQYVKRTITSTMKNESHCKNAILATSNVDRLIIFMGIIDVPFTSTHNASSNDNEKSKLFFCKLDDYKKQLMSFITGKVFKKAIVD